MDNSLLYYQTIFIETIIIAKNDEERVNHVLNMLGFSPSLAGFEYLKCAIIAEKCGVEKYKNVERGITKVREKLFLKKKTQRHKEILIWVLGILDEEYKVTNSDLIFAITRFIKEINAIN